MDSSRLLVLLGLSFTGTITAAIVYLMLKKDEETELDGGGVRTSRQTVIETKVPSEFIGTVIGRAGCNIKSIQDKTGARIHCGDGVANEKFRTFKIRGTPESAQLAESMIQEMILNQPLILSHEIWIPQRACGRIIGKGGETIRSITRVSCAKIIIDSSGDTEHSATRRVLLKGTAEQIAVAESLIEEKVQEDNDLRRRVEQSVANRSPRREHKDNLLYLMAPSDDQNEEASPRRREKFASTEGFFDVFVSAFENPGHFWVQVISQKGVELDQLIENMTDFYSKPENQEIHTLTEISVGQIVAAPFDHDDKWYRAEIIEIERNEYDPAESKVTVYYGDYGDTCTVRRKQLFDLRTDYLTLYFQAIECILAKVKPLGATWSNEAIERFEELAEVALWRKKMAHIITYRDNPPKRGQRASSPVPVIQLHDMDKGIDIGEDLVKNGFAVWESSSPTPNTDTLSSLDSSKHSSKDVSTVKPSTSQKPAEPNLDTASETYKPSEFIKTTPAELGIESSLSNGNKSKDSASSSLISKEKSEAQRRGFKPKTLKTTSKKQPSQIKSSLQSPAVVVPEIYSDDEYDEDGFTLG